MCIFLMSNVKGINPLIFINIKAQFPLAKDSDKEVQENLQLKNSAFA